MILDDEELNNVVGGLTNNEIIEKINNKYSFVPESIRKEIIEALNKFGKKAAKDLAEKLIKNKYPLAKEIINLFD